MEFEWDSRKAASNALKHAVTFEEAATVFADRSGLDGPDMQHSALEARALRLGRSAAGRLVLVAYTIRRRLDGEAIRLISARLASRRERQGYASHG